MAFGISDGAPFLIEGAARQRGGLIEARYPFSEIFRDGLKGLIDAEEKGERGTRKEKPSVFLGYHVFYYIACANIKAL
jgi:hypothetical protein